MHSMCSIILVDSPQSINIAMMGSDNDDDDDDDDDICGDCEDKDDDVICSRGGVQTIKYAILSINCGMGWM